MAEDAIPSGCARLDAQLPGGGWPRRALSELLLSQTGIGELRLVAPCLVAVQQAGRLVMVFDPPGALSARALAELGLDLDQLLVVRTHLQAADALAPAAFRQPLGPGFSSPPAWAPHGSSPRLPVADRSGPRLASPARAGGSAGQRPPAGDRLWALEQSLKSGHVGAVLAWLPAPTRSDRIRRLQLAAHAHDGPAFLFRELSAGPQASAAPLRLALRPAGADRLALRVLKRRGPPLLSPLEVALPPVLSALARQAATARPGAPQALDEDAALQSAAFVQLA